MNPSAPPSDRCVLLRDVSWSEFIARLSAEPPMRGRFAYDEGLLEIMSPSARHEKLASLTSSLIKALAEHAGLDFVCSRSTTFKQESLRKGAEPDESFYFAHAAEVVDADEIDLALHPPPDLVVEIEVTRKSLDRLRIYGTFRVPEVWRHDGTRLRFHQLGLDGTYVESEASRIFPWIAQADLSRFLARVRRDPESEIVREFREWLRGQGLGPAPRS